MIQKHFRAASILLSSLLSVSAFAAELFVSPNGNDQNPGTKASPFKTISKASTLAKPGTTVYVAPGTYAGGFRTAASGTATLPIRYVSEVKWGAKIVGSSGYNWLNLGNYVTIDGFEVTGSNTTAGLVSGPWSGGDVGHNFTAINNYIHDIAINVCGSSGAIHVFSKTGKSIITNNIVRNVAVGLMGRCPTMQGIYIAEPDTYVANNLVSGVAAVGIQQWHGATRSRIINNTVFNSLIGYLIGSGDSGTLPNGSQNNLVANNISYNNRKYGYIESGKTSLNTYLHNLVYIGKEPEVQNSINWRITGKIVGSMNANPMFVNYQANGLGNYRLSKSSSAIDSGDSSVSLPKTDLDGKARLQGRTYDSGAYEYASEVAPPPAPTPSPTPTGTISLSTRSLNFGTVAVGQTSAVQHVTIKNNGSSSITFPSVFAFSGDFATGDKGSCVLNKIYAPGSSCTASVVFKPRASGVRSGTLSIKTSASSQALVINLYGTGR